MFNIEQFLIENNIKYHTSGKDVARGNINISCPWCNEDDTKWHLGINISKNWYGCWKDTSHRGKNIAYLISKLLNCSFPEAKKIVYGSNERVVENNLRTSIKKKLFKTYFTIDSGNKSLREANLSEFNTFKTISFGGIYYRYLIDRGFDNVSLLINKYNLKHSNTGDWKGRIIFPIYIDKKLVTWQGRDITNKSKLKYKDLSKEKSIKYLKQCIYQYDDLTKGGKILYICEGVFDAIKVDFYTYSDIKATCVFTKTITQDQYKLIYKIINKFDEIRILFDQDTYKQSHQVKSELSVFHKKIKIISLPDGIKDAGDMTKEEIKKIFSIRRN